jgi:glycosyltransferase involved in cell wall biosynthesis
MKNVSIIIPTLNEKENLNRILNILKPQMGKDDEIIIVDGYSKDGTPEIAKEHGVKIIFQEPRGIGAAKTEGAKNAKNDILIFLDADSIPSDNFLPRIKSHFKNENLNALFGLDLYESDFPIRKFIYHTFSKGCFFLEAVIHKITGKYGIPANNTAYKKDIFFSVGGYRSVVCEDLDLMLRLPPSRNVKFDSNLVVLLSDRRFREKGFLRVCMTWVWCDILVLIGRARDGNGYRKL